MKQPLFPMWTVYDHPSDWPSCFVARRFDHDPERNEYFPSEAVLVAPDLERLRKWLTEMGLVKLMRNDEDAPEIVETWL